MVGKTLWALEMYFGQVAVLSGQAQLIQNPHLNFNDRFISAHEKAQKNICPIIAIFTATNTAGQYIKSYIGILFLVSN